MVAARFEQVQRFILAQRYFGVRGTLNFLHLRLWDTSVVHAQCTSFLFPIPHRNYNMRGCLRAQSIDSI